jgi:hypothetical protein
MAIPFSEPDPSGAERAKAARDYRQMASDIARLRPQAMTKSNHEESDYDDHFPSNFTKGLLHDQNGLLKCAEDYRCFVEAINSSDRTLFEKDVRTADPEETCVPFYYTQKQECMKVKQPETIKWRGWESPRGGHVYELQGADAGACGMAPAPRIGSSELAAEMAEVYALALLRDVNFTDIVDGSGVAESTSISVQAVVDSLNSMPFFSGIDRKSSSGSNSKGGLNYFERNRREARTGGLDQPLTSQNIFRGSTKGARTGPYISQFMLIGTDSLAGEGGGGAGFPGEKSSFDLEDGFIPYGSLIIDQRTISHKKGRDYMTTWGDWLDVQNGANFKGMDEFEEKRRFITTPRDLATYVHYDALYEAYLNACLIMLALKVPTSKGFPEPSPSGHRDAFATFGGPHILSLVTEVATRCLKAVRRQKFNFHRRARPEVLAARLIIVDKEHAKCEEMCRCEKSKKKFDEKCKKAPCDNEPVLGKANKSFYELLDKMPEDIIEAIKAHNSKQNEVHYESVSDSEDGKKKKDCNVYPCGLNKDSFNKENLLLPMAFPEGSPMHPSYGAGHATVAGGCVTMLKAFFEMFEDNDSYTERLLKSGDEPIAYVPNKDGSRLNKYKSTECLTIQGELDKLAANIAIGRNMAGVHYYSDYYDSLRMGERVAVSILMEQAPTYGEEMETTFTSFDGDHITIYGEAGSSPNLAILDKEGNPVNPDDWWLRHVVGREPTDDL